MVNATPRDAREQRQDLSAPDGERTLRRHRIELLDRCVTTSPSLDRFAAEQDQTVDG
jgi:hypothetical protein